jgi:anti-anti-sigma factor
MDVPQLQYTLSTNDGVATAAFVGEVDLCSIDVMRDALEQAIGSGSTLVIVDFAQLSFLDSTGIKCLIDAANDGDAAGSRLVVRNATGMVRKVLEITGIDARLIDSPDRNPHRGGADERRNGLAS